MNIRILTIWCCMLVVVVSHVFSATITYQEDGTNFPNPERGYYITQLSENSLSDARNNGMSLVRKYYNINSYTNTDFLPQSFLDGITNDAAVLRKTGTKMIPRFQYNCGGCSDPSLSRVLSHIQSVTSTLRANSDVIAFVEAGFIGMCGEWHYFGCGSSADDIVTPDARKSVLLKILSAVPDRMVALRYNFYKREMFGDVPLGSDSAFSGSFAARTGAHNDCFGYDETDRGTYQGSQTPEWQKSYLNMDNRYVPQSGESCGNASYCNCTFAQTDLKRMHWDAINSSYDGNVLNNWKNNGCYSTIQKLLGYRIKMINAQFVDGVRPGNAFWGTINLANIGWGKIYNFRGCELVFRNTVTKSQFTVKLTNDPRRWCMKEDTVVAVNISALIPSSTPSGSYSVYLNLPDTASRLYGKSAYSIRLANTGVWEDATGYNSLLHTVKIDPNASVRYHASSGKTTNFSMSTNRKNQTFTFSVQAPENGVVDFEIFTLSGKRIFSRQDHFGQNTKLVFSWDRPTSSSYIVRLRQKEQYQETYTIF